MRVRKTWYWTLTFLPAPDIILIYTIILFIPFFPPNSHLGGIKIQQPNGWVFIFYHDSAFFFFFKSTLSHDMLSFSALIIYSSDFASSELMHFSKSGS